MSKVGIKGIAASLVEKHGLSQEEAEKFITEMIDVLNDGLHYEKQVKLKGLGTFKVQSVSARKSVDVNTGSEIEIAGREKITFVPDAIMRDLVNRPFASFETTVLNDGVDFSDLDEGLEEEEASEEAMKSAEIEDKVNDNIKPIKEMNNVESTTPSDNQNEIKSQGAESKSVENSVENLVPEAEKVEETITPLVDFSGDDSAEKKMTSQEEADEISEKWAEDRLNAENKVLSSANELLHEQVSQFKKLVNIFGISAVVLLLLLIGSVFYLSRQLRQRDNRIDNLVAQMHLNDVTVKEGAAPNDDVVEVNTLVAPKKKGQANAAKPQAVKPKAEVAKAEKPAAKKPETQAQQPKAVKPVAEKAKEPAPMTQYNGDPRIRTGAYNIIGVDQVITVKKGQTIKSISKTYLGAGMECYVEALNGGDRELKEGEKIKIPKLKLKKK